jgi:hypothetical protein
LEKEESKKIALTVMNSWLRKRVLVFTRTLCMYATLMAGLSLMVGVRTPGCSGIRSKLVLEKTPVFLIEINSGIVAWKFV